MNERVTLRIEEAETEIMDTKKRSQTEMRVIPIIIQLILAGSIMRGRTRYINKRIHLEQHKIRR